MKKGLFLDTAPATVRVSHHLHNLDAHDRDDSGDALVPATKMCSARQAWQKRSWSQGDSCFDTEGEKATTARGDLAKDLTDENKASTVSCAWFKETSKGGSWYREPSTGKIGENGKGEGKGRGKSNVE